VTRTQSGVISRVQYKGLAAIVPSPVPSNYRSGLADPNWRAAMEEEFQALIDNGTWRFVPRSSGANVVSGKWIFKHKYHSDGTLAHHKAWWVVCGFSQQHDIDYDETFSPVVKPATIRAVLGIIVSRTCLSTSLM
jgi:histone deacetylase 1/2